MDQEEPVNQRSLEEPRWSCLRRYAGLRVNLFRAMHTPGIFFGDDRSVLALREGHHALAARVAFDGVFRYFYVYDCHWYRSDLSRAHDDEIPEAVRQGLLRRLLAVLG